MNRLEYLANHASATYEKIMGEYRKYGSAGIGAYCGFDLSGNARSGSVCRGDCAVSADADAAQTGRSAA